MAHINSGVIAISQTPNTTKFQKTLGINDYYLGPAAGTPTCRSGISRCSPSPTRTSSAPAPPGSRPDLALDYVAKHAIDFWMTTEDLPHPSNRVTVDRAGQIRVAKTYHNLEPHQRLLGKLKALMGPLGCHETAIPSWSILDQRIPLAGNAHHAEPCGLGPIRPAQRSTSIATRTTSTTCTSSTRASSPRAAR